MRLNNIQPVPVVRLIKWIKERLDLSLNDDVKRGAFDALIKNGDDKLFCLMNLLLKHKLMSKSHSPTSQTPGNDLLGHGLIIHSWFME